MSTLRRGFTLAHDTLTLAFVPRDGALCVQATFEDPSDPKRIIRAVLDMSTDDLASFLTDLRRAQKEISSDVEEVDAEPLAPTLPGLGEEDSGTPEQVAQAVGDVKVAAERAKTRGARA